MTYSLNFNEKLINNIQFNVYNNIGILSMLDGYHLFFLEQSDCSLNFELALDFKGSHKAYLWEDFVLLFGIEKIAAFSLETKSIVWEYETGTNLSTEVQPANGYVDFFVIEQGKAQILTLDIKDGTVRGRNVLDNIVIGSDVYPYVSVVDNRLLIASEINKQVQCYNISNGNLNWKFNYEGKLRNEEILPKIANGVLVFAEQNKLREIIISSGDTKITELSYQPEYLFITDNLVCYTGDSETITVRKVSQSESFDIELNNASFPSIINTKLLLLEDDKNVVFIDFVNKEDKPEVSIPKGYVPISNVGKIGEKYYFVSDKGQLVEL